MKKIKYLVGLLLITSLLTGCVEFSYRNPAKSDRAAESDTTAADEEERDDDSEAEMTKGAKQETVKVPFDIWEALGEIKGELTSLDVTYTIYENGAEIECIKNESAVIQEEVEFEGKIYPVISIGELGESYDFKEFEIPSHIKYINEGAFGNCRSLENLIIPETVEYISGYATFGCCGLKSLTFLGEVETDDIWESTFYWCDNLQTVTVPEGVTTLSGTFLGCKSLVSVSLPNSLKAIEASAFAETNIKRIEDIVDNMPESVEIFSARAFEECHELEELIIPDTVTSMNASGDYVRFTGMDSLRILKFPNNIIVEPEERFYIVDIETPNLELVVFPDSIEESSGDSKDYLEYFSEDLFEYVENISNLTIQVPAETVEYFQYTYPEINVVAKE